MLMLNRAIRIVKMYFLDVLHSPYRYVGYRYYFHETTPYYEFGFWFFGISYMGPLPSWIPKSVVKILEKSAH